MDTLYLIHAAATVAMAGLIWFVQIVHYPLFASVTRNAFPAYEQRHMQRTSWVVGPLMLVEAVSAVSLIWLCPQSELAWVGLVLLAIVWLSTAFLQVPQHRRLTKAFDPGAHRRLVASNWIRTAAWTMRALVALSLLSSPS